MAQFGTKFQIFMCDQNSGLILTCSKAFREFELNVGREKWTNYNLQFNSQS